MQGKHDKIKFKIGRDRSYGLTGFIIGIVVVIFTVFVIVFAARHPGMVSPALAVVALVINLLAIAGFILALRHLYKRDTTLAFPIAAMVLNGITIIFYLSIFLSGF